MPLAELTRPKRGQQKNGAHPPGGGRARCLRRAVCGRTAYLRPRNPTPLGVRSGDPYACSAYLWSWVNVLHRRVGEMCSPACEWVPLRKERHYAIVFSKSTGLTVPVILYICDCLLHVLFVCLLCGKGLQEGGRRS